MFGSIGGWSVADDSVSHQKIDFVRQIQPIFRKHCYQCHGPVTQRADLRLDVARHAMIGGDSGPVIVPGKPSQSLLFELISSGDREGRFMPPRDEFDPLSDSQLSLIQRWIAAGAEWPATADPNSSNDAPWWSFTPLCRPPLPPVNQNDWVRNSIDTFLIAKLEAVGLQPSPPIATRALVRRASLDLLGMPPDIDDLDRASGALHEFIFERYVEQLLASPYYGERWGRHWLDLVRYADTNGYEAAKPKPLAWKYRDYVIRALNNDTPYDRFIIEQLAGDELTDATSETVIATGYYRVGPWDSERAASVQQSEVVAERYNELDDIVSTTSQVFLGLTLGCARCHNHKFDPLTARDYYSLLAIFNSLKRHHKRGAELTHPAVPPPELREWYLANARIVKLNERIRELDRPLRRGLLESGQPITYPAGAVTKQIPPDAVAAFLLESDERTQNQQQLVLRFTTILDDFVDKAFEEQTAALDFLTDEALREIEAARCEVEDLSGRFDYPQAYVLYEPPVEPPVTHLLRRGSPNQLGPVVEPAVPVSIVRQSGQQQPSFDSSDGHTSHRRLTLARWIADSKNPLTARVIVNRVWQHHFGAGLVRSASDFGRRGTPPTHPELLDWLAHWFAHDAEWSLKRLHRLIMTSSAYRMSKSDNTLQAQADPDNRLWWRVPYRRLEVEAIRDSMLAASGQLDRSQYGPSVYLQIPEAARRGGFNPQGVWREFDERHAARRTIYAHVKRTLVVPFLESLDFCETIRSADRRQVTTVAPQALELLNGNFVNRQAKHFARRLHREAGPDVRCQIQHAYRLALSRPATSDEVKTLAQFWRQTRDKFRGGRNVSDAEARHHALFLVCRVIFNLSEFVYTD